jgi:hypothetical protein
MKRPNIEHFGRGGEFTFDHLFKFIENLGIGRLNDGVVNSARKKPGERFVFNV